MTKRSVSLRDNPDQPHAFQPRRVTQNGEPLQPWWKPWMGRRSSQYDPPCRHCGGSKSLPIHG